MQQHSGATCSSAAVRLQHCNIQGLFGCWQRLTVDIARQINEHNIAILIDLVGCAVPLLFRADVPWKCNVRHTVAHG